MTAKVYAEFAESEARGESPSYERLGLAISQDDEVLALLGTLPPAKWQPQLVLGAVRFLGGPVDEPVAFREFAVANWAAIEVEVLARSTQTNEAGRCAVLLPVLAALPQPLALLEVVWRAGIDLNPLDVTDPADVAWLEALIWPEQAHRRARLRAAAAVAAADPALLVRGDLADDLAVLAEQAPSDATLVVFHSSVLYQVPAPRQQEFVKLVRELPGHWLANDTPDLLRGDPLPKPPDGAAYNLVALDGRPLAWARSHGQAMTWLSRAAS